MSEVIKIIKENHLNIPVNTILHFISFYDKVKNDGSNLWDSVGAYTWQDSIGKLHIINQHEIYPALKGYYVNCITLNWKPKFLFEGDEYWNVFINENQTIYHKKEFIDGKHYPAKLFKPYKERVYSNTNFRPNLTTKRFETEQEALDYCERVQTK